MNKIERQVLLMIGEDPDNPDVFTDDEVGIEQIRKSILDGISEVLMQTGGQVEQFRLPLQANQTFYKIELQNSDVCWFKSVWNCQNEKAMSQTSLIALNAFDPLWMRHTGEPTQYFPLSTSTIGICPKPSATGNVIECQIAVIPKEIRNDHSPLKIKKLYERSVVNYAISEYYASRGAAREAAEHLQLFAESLGMQRTYQSDNSRTYQYTINKESNEDIKISP